MEFAINDRGMRISAYEADKDMRYTCQCCGNEVILRKGELNIWHFAHKVGECTDTWNYDMSEWHRKMQELFRPENREVVIWHGKKAHRADVLKDNIVVEFQHSPISSAEFSERNAFYLNAGYRIAWIFDVTDAWDSGRISILNEEQEAKLRWKNPLRMLQYGPIPQNNSKDISICISTTIDEELEEDIYHDINRVNWSSINENGDPDYRYLSINYDCCIDISEDMDMNIFFFTPKDFVNEYTKMYKPYQTKLKGRIKGYPKRSYCCDITNNWIDIRKCEYCKYCAFREQFHISKDEIVNKFFCCYPRIVNEDHGVPSIFH